MLITLSGGTGEVEKVDLKLNIRLAKKKDFGHRKVNSMQHRLVFGW